MDRLTSLAPHFVVRGMPLVGVSVTTGAPDASARASATLPFDDGDAESTVLRLADALSVRERPPR